MIVYGNVHYGDRTFVKKNFSKIKKKDIFDYESINGDLLDITVGIPNHLKSQGEVIKNGDLICMGKVFTKEDYKPLTKALLTKYNYDNIESFVDDNWGNYIIIATRGDKVKILRDPVGQFELFYKIAENGQVIFASETKYLLSDKSTKHTLNQDYLCHYILNGTITGKQTAFNGIYELPSGCVLELNRGKHDITLAWDPSKYCKQKYPIEQIPEKIVETIQNILRAWTKDNDKIMLHLSGGLDSSSLLYCLNSIKTPHQEIKALNYYHSGVRSSYEVDHAQKVAKDNTTEIVEYDASKKNTYLFTKKSINQFNINKPTASLMGIDKSENLEDYKSLQISGHGGDHIFLCPPPKESVCDEFFDNGFKAGIKHLEKLVNYYRGSYLQIGKENISSLLQYIFKKRYKTKETVQNIPNWINYISTQNKELLHPFYQKRTTKFTPGKFKQIHAIFSCYGDLCHDNLKYDGKKFYPLIMQPIIELILSIPVYELLHNGYDRYLFRKGISEYFKTDLVWRKDKGETSGILQKEFKAENELVLSLCTDGYFKNNGLVDKNILEDDIKSLMNGSNDSLWPIIHLLNVEYYVSNSVA